MVSVAVLPSSSEAVIGVPAKAGGFLAAGFFFLIVTQRCPTAFLPLGQWCRGLAWAPGAVSASAARAVRSMTVVRDMRATFSDAGRSAQAPRGSDDAHQRVADPVRRAGAVVPQLRG